MENPATWNEAEKVIWKAIEEYEKARANGVIGFSKPRCIYRALKDAGFCMIQDKKK